MEDIYWQMGDEERLEMAEYTWAAFDSFYEENGAEELPLDNWGVEEIPMEHLIDRIRNEEYCKWGFLKNCLEKGYIEELKEEGEGSLVKVKGTRDRGHLFNALERIGLMEQWGGTMSPYEIKGSREDINRFQGLLEEKIEKEQKDEEKKEEKYLPKIEASD